MLFDPGAYQTLVNETDIYFYDAGHQGQGFICDIAGGADVERVWPLE
jgi:hypothetical protein